jgi:hypothetical protein
LVKQKLPFVFKGGTALMLHLNSTKQFIIDKNDINKVSIIQNQSLKINLKLEPEMFERVAIEASISKADSIVIKNIDLTIINDQKQIIDPVFQPLAWDSSHFETIQMNSFCEINEYTKMNKFALSAQYSIEQTD